MELLSPKYPPNHVPSSPEFVSGFSSPASFPVEFDRAITCQVSDIVEDDGDKVYVAVGKSVEKALCLLNWTFRQFKGNQVCILHVSQPSHLIPTHLGKLPAAQANVDVVSAYRKYEREQALKLLQSYLSVCSGAEVTASLITVEANQVQKGIVDLVNEYGIRKLVMGAVTENFMKVKKRSSKAYHVAKNAPLFCEIWFVNKGKHVWTRHSSEDPSSLPSCSRSKLATIGKNIFRSFLHGKNKSIHLNWLQFNSASGAICAQLRNQVQCEPFHPDLASSSTLYSSPSTFLSDLNGLFSPTSANVGSGYNSSERRVSLDSDEERLYSQLIDLRVEAETSRNNAHLDTLKRRKLESDAIEAISKAEMLDSAFRHEGKLRKEAEDALKITLEEQEILLKERKDITLELHRTMRNVALLDSRAQEALNRNDEASDELKLVQESIATLRQEKHRIRKQKMEAVRWLERWRSRGQGRGVNCTSLIGCTDELPELAEFSLSDLETATCNFSESFIIGHGGYGCVYKGELLGRTVAIKKLHSYNLQGESEFQQEVKVLGKLQHPHLVALLGVCPDAWSLVYEYLPNGSLQCHLFKKNNVLTWKVRARIIAEIASALCFLHSSKTQKIVHGDLTPRNILLDSALSCKICDFGICRMINEDNLYCPSLRWSKGPKGAFCYTDPEFQRIGVLTSKSDAYSFGLITLQLLTRRPPVGLAGEVRKAISSAKLASILDSSAGEWPNHVVRRLVDIGLQCCELNGRDRPDITPCLVRELEQLHVSEERLVPSFFLCPILQEIMHDPQVAADGFTYERDAIQGWLENGKETSPMTNLKLSHLHLIPNHAIRLAIQEWLCKA
ncbi:hypothetical protein G4B88_003620 [Cannabis sativa]|uniref:RING-type E3 ubiquitin transferase n=1 Tax=Cannabis sativa TaxID=3483 RepID=A0A7J6FDI4_CANSA|nr:hypothetical protein G4B88_003620 [Cannabis sativa]